MTRTNSRLLLALLLSVILHFAPLIGEIVSTPAKTRPPIPEAVVKATIRPAELAPADIPLRLEKPPPPSSALPKKPDSTKTTQSPAKWTSSVRQQLKAQQERGEFYPAEAIARGLEGEALVLVMLDASGEVSAARLESSSGHKILDGAALQAVRSLHSIPADAPRELLLPVRFRLRQ